MNEVELQAAIKEAIQTEKDAMDFYKYGAEKMDNDKAKSCFELLAKEEKQHARMFFEVYKGSDIPSFETFMQQPPNTDSSWWDALQKLERSQYDERRAMELAMEQEDALAQNLLKTAETISDEAVKAIYITNAQSTNKHSELIGQDYHDIYG